MNRIGNYFNAGGDMPDDPSRAELESALADVSSQVEKIEASIGTSVIEFTVPTVDAVDAGELSVPMTLSIVPRAAVIDSDLAVHAVVELRRLAGELLQAADVLQRENLEA